MAKLPIKEEPMDCEIRTPSENIDCHGGYTLLNHNEGSTAYFQISGKSQPQSSSEKTFVKEELTVQPSESLTKDHEESQICHDVEILESNVNDDSEVFNIQEEVEITVEEFKIEDDNWRNELSTCETAKEGQMDDYCPMEDIEPKENKSEIESEENMEITIKDIKSKTRRRKTIKPNSKDDILIKTMTNPKLKCSVKGCGHTKLIDHSLQFFSFPIHSTDLCEQWIAKCGDESLRSLSKTLLCWREVCERHFTEDSFERKARRGLKNNAVPTIQDDSAIGDQKHLPIEQLQETELFIKKASKKKKNCCLYLNKCSFMRCQRSTHSDPLLQCFGFPLHNPDLCLQWIHNCGITVKNHLQRHRYNFLNRLQVCEKHFTQESFESVTGKTLKTDAVPSELCTEEADSTISQANSILAKSIKEIQITPFMIYSRKMWNQIKAQNPTISLSRLTKIIRQMWDDLPEKDQAEYFVDVGAKKKGEHNNLQNNIPKECYPERFLFDDVFESLGLPENHSGSTDLTSLDEKGDHNNLQNDIPKKSYPERLLFDDVLESFDLPENHCGSTALSSQDEKGENINLQNNTPNKSRPERLLVDDVLESFGLPENHWGSTNLTSQDVAPLRTYKRTAAKRPNPACWGDTKNEENTEKVMETKTSSRLQPREERNIPNLLCKKRKNNMNATPVTTGEPQTTSLGGSGGVPPTTYIYNLYASTNKQVHSCFYCSDVISQMKQHLLIKHSNEEEVKTAISLKKTAQEKEFILIRRAGDFKHNCCVLKKGSGSYIDMWGTSHDINTLNKDTFMPCPDCTGFLPVTKLKLHHDSCQFKATTTVKRNIFVESEAMIACTRILEFIKLETYISKRLKSRFGPLAKNDELIMLFIPYLFSSKECQDTSATLVLLQRLGFLLQLYQIIVDDKKIKFQQILRPENIHTLSKALQCYFSQTKRSERPELYKYLHSHISLSALMWRGKCLMDGNIKSANKALLFFYYFTMNEELLKTIDLIESNPVDLDIANSVSTSLNFTPAADIISFKNSLNERMVELADKLCDKTVLKEFAKYVWHDLAEATLCYLSLINPIDFVAIEELKLVEYATRPDSVSDDLTKYKSMIPSFCRFSDNLMFVCTEYMDNEIAILLLPPVKKAIDILIKGRLKAGIPVTHPNVFAGCDAGVISAMNSFYNVCIKQGGILSSDALSDLKIRRQISYIIHISEISHRGMELLEDYFKSLNDKNSFSQTSPKDYYDFETDKEFNEALGNYKVNYGISHQTHELYQDIKQLTPLVTEKNNDKCDHEKKTSGKVKEGIDHYKI